MVNMISQLCRLDGSLSWIGSGRGEPTFSYSFLSSYSVDGLQSFRFVCDEPEVGQGLENEDFTNYESLNDEHVNSQK